MKDLWDAQNLSIPQKVIYNGKRFFRFVIVFKLQKNSYSKDCSQKLFGEPKMVVLWLRLLGKNQSVNIITSDKNCYIHMLYHQQHPIFCVKFNFTFTQKT